MNYKSVYLTYMHALPDYKSRYNEGNNEALGKSLTKTKRRKITKKIEIIKKRKIK